MLNLLRTADSPLSVNIMNGLSPIHSDTASSVSSDIFASTIMTPLISATSSKLETGKSIPSPQISLNSLAFSSISLLVIS